MYISTPSTYVLTHTSQGAIGITTRTGESLDEFHNTILAEPKLTNLGIMKSPGTALVTLLILYREGRELMVMERAIRRLGNLELSVDQELTAFCDRTDEIGLIAQTIHHVCNCLRKTIDDIGRILGEMAEGNIAVDVEKNAS